MASSSDNAAKAKIISHMNNDHHISAYDGRMTGVDLNGFTLQANAKSYRVAFHPPLTSYAQVRERVVELDKLSRQMLRQSEVTIKKFYWPTGIWAVLLTVTIATWVGFSQRWWFAKGGPVAQIAGEAFAAFNYRIQPWVLYGLLGAHVVESAVFASQKLPVHSVNPRTATFWLWTLDLLIEGKFADLRFDYTVKRLADEKRSH